MDATLPCRYLPLPPDKRVKYGCQLTHNIYSELGYRYLYLDYDTTSFVYQVSMHGAQVTVGMNF